MILCWIRECRITEGYIFRRFLVEDRISPENKPVVRSRSRRHYSISKLTSRYKSYFESNLIDIGQDPTPYGTHSFRRGGCQYLSSEKLWGIRKLCDWGDFENLIIVRYLMSWNDDPTMRREDFLNPVIQFGRLCNYCGRKCACDA